jgi:hypothetical protein
MTAATENPFSMRSVPRYYNWEVWSLVEREFCTEGREPGRVKLKNRALLEAVARERLVKTAGWERFSGCCGDLWRLTMAL